jgi:hypothetical protein
MPTVTQVIPRTWFVEFINLNEPCVKYAQPVEAVSRDHAILVAGAAIAAMGMDARDVLVHLVTEGSGPVDPNAWVWE